MEIKVTLVAHSHFCLHLQVSGEEWLSLEPGCRPWQQMGEPYESCLSGLGCDSSGGRVSLRTDLTVE
jgi:hypothetical protein